MARDHKLFHDNGKVLNRHFHVIDAARPVVKALLRFGVTKVNTAGSFYARGGHPSIRIGKSDTGLTVKVRGDGHSQVLHAVTADPAGVETALAEKFPELVKNGSSK